MDAQEGHEVGVGSATANVGNGAGGQALIGWCIGYVSIEGSPFRQDFALGVAIGGNVLAGYDGMGMGGELIDGKGYIFSTPFGA